MIITKATFSASGNEVTLYIEAGENITVSRADYKKILSVAQAEDFPLELDDKHAPALEILGQKLSCIKACASFLAYGDKSESALIKKLDQKGFHKKAQELAMQVLKKDGCVDDFSQCKRLISRYANEKYFGLRRIKQELFKKGYNKKAIEDALQNCEIDFDEIARLAFCVLSKRCDLTDTPKRKKLFNTLIRNGHDYDTVCNVMKIEDL